MTAFIAGSGPDKSQFETLAGKLNIVQNVNFAGPTPAREAFSKGRCLVVPSRAESFPYIVLEAAAARLPLICTNVGGIPEIVLGSDSVLVEASDTAALTREMQAFLDQPQLYRARAKTLQDIVVSRYTVKRMVADVTRFYSEMYLKESS